jgi:primosomal protein N'
MSTQVFQAAQVFCDDQVKVGTLSYLVPNHLKVCVGDAVHVPFGRRELHGLVLGPAKDNRATREILRVFGPRVSEEDLGVLRELAEIQSVPIEQMLKRISPSKGRNQIKGGYPHPKLLGDLGFDLPKEPRRRYFLVPPLMDIALVAATEAVRMVESGQVLVLCPTVELVDMILEKIKEGGARLDAKAEDGAWGAFRSGNLQIGVGTRAAAFYSPAKLGGIIVVEDSHLGHLEQTQPQTHSRDVASMRTLAQNAEFVLISKIPTAEGSGIVQKVYDLSEEGYWPKMTLVDRSILPPAQKAYPPSIRKIVNDKLVVIVQKNPTKRCCRNCNSLRHCAVCDLTTYCGHSEASICETCKQKEFYYLGWDAKRVRDLLGETPTIITLAELREGQEVLRGKENLFFFDFDAAIGNGFLLMPDNGATRVLLEVLALGGSGIRVWIGTKNPEYFLIDATIRRQRLTPIAQYLYRYAKENSLPPFGHLVTIRSAHRYNLENWPVPVFGPKKNKQGQWEWLIVVKRRELGELLGKLRELRARGKTRILIQ